MSQNKIFSFTNSFSQVFNDSSKKVTNTVTLVGYGLFVAMINERIKVRPYWGGVTSTPNKTVPVKANQV